MVRPALGLLGGGEFPAVADAAGEWEVQFNGGGVGHGPGTVTVSGEDGPDVVAKNVMGGDVYFCAGQSNMVFPTKLAYNPAEEMATLAQYKNFRFFATARDYSPVPLWDLRPSPTKVRQKLGQLQPFIAVLPQECMGHQLASSGPT
jgi:sialate O-acetylesterase